MKTFAQKSREYYNRLAEGYNTSLEARYTMRFKRMLLDEIVIEPMLALRYQAKDLQ